MVYSEVKIPVRYYETDQMGIVHHSNYIRYFECARIHLMEECGCPIEVCERLDSVTFPIVSVECRYRHPARMGDVLTVTAQIDALPLAKTFYTQKVFNQDGILCAEGKVVVGSMDKITGKPLPCPQRIIDAFTNYFK